ncbi:MAG TPA: N-acetylmuramic acid 6-phosphate etherase [Phycisphaerales bacterium]|jgi:N-acetylmuramic acid 6-phosphate etherase|nr:N-acetylmuramic acid 6-phosphate etherase [Phycisphaerales bacterium]
MSAPPDRSHLLTEQRNPRSMRLHELSVRDCVDLFNAENRLINDAMERAAPALTAFIEAASERFNAVGGGGRLIYIGAGTSGRLGVLDASECPPTFHTPPDKVVGLIAGGDSALRVSSEGKEDDPAGAHAALAALNLTPNDTLLGIAAGGTTPYVLGALTFAKTPSASPKPELRNPQSPLTALLTCAPIPKPAAADHLIIIETGPELLTGSTRLKAGTATKLALNTISTTLMIRAGRIHENLMVDLKATNDKLKDRAARIISTLTNLPREEALALLDRANGNVKTALALHARG